MKTFKTNNKNFYKKLKVILAARSQNNIPKVDEKVKKIISEVKLKGDEALFNFAKKFDKSNINTSNILISKKIIKSYKKKINPSIMKAFNIAIKNVKNFHKKQKPKNFKITKEGSMIESIWKPIESVGLYIPGGKSVYPSSLIMNVIPAQIAGVKRIVVVTPTNFNEINPYILALLDKLSIDEMYQVGGAHAIAALAYGTKSIKPVNKIFGPGNSYVASAKKQVFGKVGIDLIAGPSEIIVVADKFNNPDWVASDLLAQAEHDENAQSILITDDINFSKKVFSSIEKLSMNLSKQKTIKKSLDNFGLVVLVDDFNQTSEIINFIAPEHLHLHLQTKLSNKILKNVINAGAIFIGEYTPEAFGDYIIGTNHILPTSGSAKFSSGLGVLDFMKRSSIVRMNLTNFKKNCHYVERMAEVEKLDGHKLSVKIRQIKKINIKIKK